MDLYDYQKRPATDAMQRRLIVVPYGAGKTAITLTAMRREYNATTPFVALIASPKRNIRTWRNEIAKWWPNLVIVGHNDIESFGITGDEKPFVIIATHQWIRDNEDTLQRLTQQFAPFAFVCDESTVIKNPKAGVTAVFHYLANTWQTGGYQTRCIALTGNPVPEAYQEIWAQFQFCYGRRNPFGDSFYKFSNHWFLKTDYSYVLRHEKEARFISIVDQYSTTLNAEEYAAFREKVGVEKRNYIIETYEPNAEQSRLLAYLRKHWALPGDGKPDTDFNYVMQLASKEQQICGGFYYDVDGGDVWLSQTPAKLHLLNEIVTELVAQGEQRIIIWHYFDAEALIILNAVLNAVPADDTTLVMFSQQPAVTDPPLIIVVPVGMARGLNDLVTAQYAIIYSNSYKQEMRDQLEARTDRLGQTASSTFYIDLASPNCIDMAIVVALQSKNLTEDRMATVVRERYPQPPRKIEVP